MTTNQPSRLDQIEALQLQAQQQINATQQQVNANVTAIAELTANAEADRKMIWAAMQQHDVTIARIDKLLDYLFSKQGNGHGNQP